MKTKISDKNFNFKPDRSSPLSTDLFLSFQSHQNMQGGAFLQTSLLFLIKLPCKENRALPIEDGKTQEAPNRETTKAQGGKGKLNTWINKGKHVLWPKCDEA